MVPEDDKMSVTREVDWLSVVINLQAFVSCLFAFHFIINYASLLTTTFFVVLTLLTILGTTAGAHRLWAHHTYKATASLRLFLMLCHTLGGNGSIYNWVRLHRLHHDHFQTDLDPYNSGKGFIHSFFICGFAKLSQAQENLLKNIDMSDLENDKIVMFQKKYYWALFAVVTILLPINAPLEYWDETVLNTLFIIGCLRLSIIYNMSLLIHSASPIFDYNHEDRKSFDSNAVFFVNKSYWLSYHYMSPWDYQTSEYGKYGTDCTSKFIRVCAALEFASCLRTADSQLIRNALNMAVDEKKSFSECINILESGFNKKMAEQFYLTPSKFY